MREVERWSERNMTAESGAGDLSVRIHGETIQRKHVTRQTRQHQTWGRVVTATYSNGADPLVGRNIMIVQRAVADGMSYARPLASP